MSVFQPALHRGRPFITQERMMKPPIIAALMAVINSTDVTDSGIYYRGKISHFLMSHRSSLYAEAKRENPDLRPPIFRYCACRWNYRLLQKALDTDTKTEVKQTLYHDYIIEITNTVNGKRAQLRPVDWGPARWTGRIIDIDPVTMRELDLRTDDEVEIVLRKRK